MKHVLCRLRTSPPPPLPRKPHSKIKSPLEQWRRYICLVLNLILSWSPGGGSCPILLPEWGELTEVKPIVL
jgi:hypothetical protein